MLPSGVNINNNNSIHAQTARSRCAVSLQKPFIAIQRPQVNFDADPLKTVAVHKE